MVIRNDFVCIQQKIYPSEVVEHMFKYFMIDTNFLLLDFSYLKYEAIVLIRSRKRAECAAHCIDFLAPLLKYSVQDSHCTKALYFVPNGFYYLFL